MEQILAKFRPLASLARELGIGYKRVSKWSERNSIPATFDLRLVEIAKRRGIALSLEDIAKARAEAAGNSDVDVDNMERS